MRGAALSAMMMGLVLTGCGSGVTGIAIPPPMEMTRIERPSTPNTALAAPADFTPKPDIVTQPYEMPAETLYRAVITMAEGRPRTYLLTRYDDRLQAHLVARSAVFGFPDLVAVQVLPEGENRSRLVIWSRSVYGRYDFGVNRRRVADWLAAIASAQHAA